MKVVHKPWGKEVWLELNDRYCYKRIYINKGTRTSYQYHEKKLETNFIISGQAEIWLENDEGIVEKTIMNAGEYFTVHPPKKHRVIAITDLILQEVSTPEVDDVIRLSDDTNRDNGKIEDEHLKPAMCILTAGLGNRLGDYTKHINKSLLPLNNIAALSHIINKTPRDYDIIIALGYKGQQVKDYCKSAHPDRNFKFVVVDSFSPESTGPATSFYACKELLQRPFYFCACDVYIEEDMLPPCNSNWLGLSRTVLTELYATARIDESNRIVKIKDKDQTGYEYAWTGLMSVFSFREFWKKFDSTQVEIPEVISRLIEECEFNSKFYTWYDLGTLDNYNKAKKILEKESESDRLTIPKINGDFLYKSNDNVIKINQSKENVLQIVKRGKKLKETLSLPDIEYANENVYSYKWVDGKTLYAVDNTEVFKKFLKFCTDSMWKKSADIENNKRQEILDEFYLRKLSNRINTFLSSRDRNMYSKEIRINGLDVRSLDAQLDEIATTMSNHEGIFVEDFHGDFHFENILYDNKNEVFSLIDWRPNFGIIDHAGDVYYDLGKLYAGLVVHFNNIKNESKISVDLYENSVNLSNSSTENIIAFIPTYESWIKENNYDLDRVKLVASIVLLGISCLHEKIQSDFIYFSGRRLLDESRKV